MKKAILTGARFLLFVLLGYHIIEPPVNILSLKNKGLSYLRSQAEYVIDEVFAHLNSERRKTDPAYLQGVFKNLTIPANDKLEKDIGGYSMEIQLLVHEERYIPNPMIQDPDREEPATKRKQTVYRTAATYPYDNYNDSSFYKSSDFFYPEIHRVWVGGEREEYHSSYSISLTWLIPFPATGPVGGVIMVGSSAWNLATMLENMWTRYRLKLVILIPVLFLAYILLEYFLIKRTDQPAVIRQMDSPSSDRWIPPWLTILFKNPSIIILFILFYPLMAYYLFDLNNLDFGIGLHILFLSLMGIPLFLPLIFLLVLPGLKHRHLFRYGELRPSAYKGSEEFQVYTSRGYEIKSEHILVYEYKGRIYELKVSPSEIKKLAKQEEYHVLFLPEKPDKAILLEMYLARRDKPEK